MDESPLIARDPGHSRNLLTPDYRRVGPVYHQAPQRRLVGCGRDALTPAVDGTVVH